jgi:hypothetical protein
MLADGVMKVTDRLEVHVLARTPGELATRHTSGAKFVAFLKNIATNQPRGKDILVIAYNLSTRESNWNHGFLHEKRAIT